MSGRHPAAVLFDMDGLLVATEHVWFEVESAMVTELGGTWGPDDQELLVGGPLERTVDHMLATLPRNGAGPDAEGLRDRLLTDMVARLRRGPVEWMPGARRLLAEVAASALPCALVSSSRRPVVDAVLDAIGRELLPVTVSGDDVARTKPHPDPYLLGARLLGVDPRACVALEDSATGAMSARAAGCVTVVVPSVAGVADGIADHRVGSLEELSLARLGSLVRAL
ncbi:MAG: HAD family phosphatase [Sporichthyaceae bacterium]